MLGRSPQWRTPWGVFVGQRQSGKVQISTANQFLDNMTKQEFYSHLEQVLEADPGTVMGQESLRDLSGWNSLAVISFIAMVDSTLDISISARDIVGCKTVNDLLGLCGDKITN